MKRTSLRCTLAAASLAGIIAAGGAAQAQVWFEFRPWGAGPRIYEEGPPVVHGRVPEYMAPYALPPAAVRRIVERRGFDVIGPVRLSGDVYVVPVEDRRGRAIRILVDAATGEFVQRIPFEGPPRPPANVGRARDRYAIAPHESELPPPQGRWRENGFVSPVPPPAVNEGERRARERFARQAPGGAAPLRGQWDAPEPAPALRPGIAAPTPRAVEPQRDPARRATTQERKKPPAKRQAAPKPVDEKKLEVARPEPARMEAGKPAQAPKVETPKAEATRTDTSRRQSAKAEPNTTVVAPTPKSEAARSETRKPQPGGNASILRRPSQKADDAKSGERKGVAEGAVVSTGAEPQRRAPRVVYPGPGGSGAALSGQ
jgi:hypothetical protein